MKTISKKLKNIFKSSTKNCPNCDAELSSQARICPECGHNFLQNNESKKPFTIEIIKSYNSNLCCPIIFLIILAGAYVVWKSEFLQSLVMVVVALILIVIVLLLLLFAGPILKLRKLFGF